MFSGNGDVIEPDEGIVAIGSGGVAAQAAAAALLRYGDYAGGAPNPTIARVHALLGDAEAATAIWDNPYLPFAIQGEDPCLDPDYAAIRDSEVFRARFPACDGD